MNTTYDNNTHSRGFAQGFIRPAWTPATIAMMIIGFMIFWPLGLAMIAYILWGDRLDSFKQDVSRTTDSVAKSFRNAGCCGARRGYMHSQRTGNVAFDDWREAEIARLEEERNKLDETRREFDEHLSELRRAKDEEEFNSFMSSRSEKHSGKKSDTKKGKSVPDTK